VQSVLFLIIGFSSEFSSSHSQVAVACPGNRHQRLIRHFQTIFGANTEMLRTKSTLSHNNHAMNIGGNGSTSFHGTPVHEGGTTYLKEAQEEALSEAPSSPALTWRRTMQSERVVASLLPQPLEPFDKSDRKRAYTSAIYYSECFLRGVTPNDADYAAVNVQQQYKRWWVNGTVQEGDITNIKTKTGLQCEDGPDDIPVVSDDSLYQQGEHRSKRRKSRSLRDMIEDISLSRQADHVREGDDRIDIRSITNLTSATREQIESVRDRVIAHLKIKGDLESEIFKSGLEILQSYYLLSQCDVRQPEAPFELEGTWLTLSKPTFTECKGRNAAGDQIYALGRMSFDMFRPTGLRCSIQGNFNSVYELRGEIPQNIPRSLRKSMQSGMKNGGVKGLRTYK
jgi:hypothetical protein